MWIVSVESLPVPARDVVVDALHRRLGMSMVMVNGSGSPFKRLIGTLKAASMLSGNVMLCAPWLTTCHRDPALGKVYRGLAKALVSAFGMQDARHLMVCMRACPAEAFEHAMKSSPSMCLHDLRVDQALLTETHLQSPFRATTIVNLSCPAYAADTPEALDAITEEAYEAVAAALAT